jgi:sporulation related protein
MTDIRADENAPDEEDRLPWLEAVDEDEERDGPSPLKLIASVLIGLIAIGAIVGGIFWMGNRDGQATRDDQLIAAPEGDYKVKPADPGGMAVEGEGDTAFAASAGGDPKGAIDTNAVTEVPVVGRDKSSDPPAAPPAAAPAAPAPPKAAPPAAPAPAAAGPAIQLGAFSSAAGANNAWKALSARFAYLAPLAHNVTPTQSGGRTLYRLRASGPGASGLCGRLRAAGESCVTVD